jgi:hypothetical protein
VRLYKLAVLLASGGALLGFSSCGRLLIDAIYLLPQLTDSLSSLTSLTSGTTP